MSDYKFTQDWFHWAPDLWKQLTPMLPEGETYGAADHGIRHFLEIGSFEGRRDRKSTRLNSSHT